MHRWNCWRGRRWRAPMGACSKALAVLRAYAWRCSRFCRPYSLACAACAHTTLLICCHCVRPPAAGRRACCGSGCAPPWRRTWFGMTPSIKPTPGCCMPPTCWCTVSNAVQLQPLASCRVAGRRGWPCSRCTDAALCPCVPRRPHRHPLHCPGSRHAGTRPKRLQRGGPSVQCLSGGLRWGREGRWGALQERQAGRHSGSEASGTHRPTLAAARM